ncbi:F-box protein SKIP16 [Diospyros lotus]|uniref:F-box protein SKIP16 n=1 Tax=Diospyros lotus TaxID=55363 RepID=UPI002258D7D4|nr:F-box protein SKIP16 [Diospyros lotus]
MNLDGLESLAIHEILSKLGPADTASVACVSKKFKDVAADDSLWSKFCADELQISSPQDPSGTPTSTFKEAYQIWRETFAMYPWSLVRRVKRCWDKLKSWLSVNFPEALATLRNGATEDQIKELEDCLRVKLPLPTRILYRFCDGQAVNCEEFGESMPGSPFGLIGGYSFYDHVVNVYLLPLREVINETRDVIDQLGFSSRSKIIVVAASSTYRGKIFFLDCANGRLYVGTRNLTVGREMMPCVPNSFINLSKRGNQQQDGMLLWLEEHGRRLHDGIIKVREEGGVRSINLFPEEAPNCTTAVTNGVKVRASAVFVPEHSSFQRVAGEYLFAYSIRMSLLPGGCIINGLSFTSCQLYRRQWTIRANDTIISEANGEAVIGKFPLLRPGEGEFVYESCTFSPSPSGSIEGSFTFVPGSLADPMGESFGVAVAHFPLQLPDYIY